MKVRFDTLVDLYLETTDKHIFKEKHEKPYSAKQVIGNHIAYKYSDGVVIVKHPDGAYSIVTSILSDAVKSISEPIHNLANKMLSKKMHEIGADKEGLVPKPGAPIEGLVVTHLIPAKILNSVPPDSYQVYDHIVGQLGDKNAWQ